MSNHYLKRLEKPEATDIKDTMATFISDCNDRMRNFIDQKKAELTHDADFFLHHNAAAAKLPDYNPSHDIDLIFAPLSTLAHGGKRTRARLVFLGFFSVTEDITQEEYQLLVDIACAVEIFQLAALIHDDIIDESDTRRGSHSTHIIYRDLYTARGLPAAYAAVSGKNAAILLGDLALAFANEVYVSSADALPTTLLPAFYRSNQLFLTMHSQVMLGQFLDILAESTPLDASALPRAHLITILKSALYSAVYPLQLGSLIAGAEQRFLDELQSYALPLGQAFQLRDDILGVFGDQGITGKPQGDDIREGKQTVLILYALDLLDNDNKKFLTRVLGNAEASVSDIAELTQLIKKCGALTQLENTIEKLSSCAAEHMPHSIPQATQKILENLSYSIVNRNT